MNNRDVVAIVLAAGQSKRFKSAVPKVLHDVCGRMMIEYVLDAAREAGANRMVVVVGHCAELVQDRLSRHSDVEFALQSERKGTGHAVMMCESQLADHDGPTLILAGDTPLLRSETLASLLSEQKEHHAACIIGTAVTEANEGLGRIVRDDNGGFVKIVEQKDATPDERRIKEINTGCYAFDNKSLFHSLSQVETDNKQGEYYLTDCPQILLEQGRCVRASDRFTIQEALGVNTRVQLAAVSRVIQAECMERLMLDGVTIVDPAQTWIDPRVTIGQDTVIHPFTTIRGEVKIGGDCTIGPHSVIHGPLDIPPRTTVAPFEILDN